MQPFVNGLRNPDHKAGNPVDQLAELVALCAACLVIGLRYLDHELVNLCGTAAGAVSSLFVNELRNVGCMWNSWRRWWRCGQYGQHIQLLDYVIWGMKLSMLVEQLAGLVALWAAFLALQLKKSQHGNCTVMFGVVFAIQAVVLATVSASFVYYEVCLAQIAEHPGYRKLG